MELARKRYQRGSVRLKGKVYWGYYREDVRDAAGNLTRRQVAVRLGEKNKTDLPTDKMALRALEPYLNDVNALTYRPRTLANFEQFSKRWQSAVMVNHKRSAQASEKSIIKVHLLPRWGSRSMKELEADPEAMQSWAAALDIEPKTQRNIVKLMRRMLDIAIEWGYMKYNPLARVQLKPLKLVEEFALSLEQIRSIINTASEPWKTMYWILGETGIRAGEVLALGWEHVDLAERVIYIRRKLWRGEFETVKSRKGVRSFAISAQLAEHLKNMCGGVDGHARAPGLSVAQAKLGPGWRSSPNLEQPPNSGYQGPPALRKSGQLFPDVTYDHVLKEVFQPFLATLKIPKCGFHAFRHGNATLMDQLQTPSKVRMDRLGHEKLDTTMGYTHVVSEDDRRVADQLGDLLTEAVQ